MLVPARRDDGSDFERVENKGWFGRRVPGQNPPPRMPRSTLAALLGFAATLGVGAARAETPPAGVVAPAPAMATGAAAPVPARPPTSEAPTPVPPPSEAPTAAAPPSEPSSSPSEPGGPTTLASPTLAPAQIDRGTPATPPGPGKRRPWRDTWLVWQNTVSTQTIHIGGSYQSSDPTYEMSVWIRPRYYFIDTDDELLSIGGRVDVIREFTNSDVTTEKDETTLSDATLYTSYGRRLAGHGEHGTFARIVLPILTFPTSKFSYSNGTILGVGTELRLTQAMPLAGPDAPVFKRLSVAAAVGYTHTFTRAVVPTDPELRRVRMDPDGNSVPGDQLVGAAFPEHELQLSVRMAAEITDRLSLFMEGAYRPEWKYGFGNVSDCGVVSTGCAPVPPGISPTRYVALTQFEAFLDYELTDGLGAAIGYINLEQQPAPDGQRRSILWSPGAQFYFQIVGQLDAIYLAATGHHGEPGTASVFWL